MDNWLTTALKKDLKLTTIGDCVFALGYNLTDRTPYTRRQWKDRLSFLRSYTTKCQEILNPCPAEPTPPILEDCDPYLADLIKWKINLTK